ncbi:hypothetical protein BU204_27110 [Actinophytocola xanthii]|uniref:Ricin B lectin domain-containing protein n=1 Tax=Actinophytocola xanthii TaxID=1912961 RepID=A0A1Q8CGM4_9PSEU|nr:hypothetical protein BU204_27110 [Actinophytocola xanthii]
MCTASLIGLAPAPATADYLAAFTGAPLLVSNSVSGEVLDVAGSSTTDGAGVQTFAFHGKANQNWRFRSQTVDGQPYWYLVVQHSGKCLDVQWGSHDEAPVWQWGCNQGDAQLWALDSMGTTPDRFGVATSRLRNKGSGMCLTAPAPFSALVQRPCAAGDRTQDWQFTHAVASSNSRVLLTVSGTVPIFNDVDPRAFTGSPLQNLQLTRASDRGAFRVTQPAVGCLRPVSGLFALLDPPARPGIGTSLAMYPCNDTDTAQIWRATEQSTGPLGETIGNIRNDYLGLCLAFDGIVAPEQAPLSMQPCGNAFTQRWFFYL